MTREQVAAWLTTHGQEVLTAYAGGKPIEYNVTASRSASGWYPCTSPSFCGLPANYRVKKEPVVHTHWVLWGIPKEGKDEDPRLLTARSSKEDAEISMKHLLRYWGRVIITEVKITVEP